MPSAVKFHFDIHPMFLILSIGMLYLMPLQWISAWLLAIIVHETSHLLALRLMNVHISEIKISIFGATIITDAMHPLQEFICALAGPIGALCLLLLRLKYPELAICALFQSIYNLLPLYPLDGGRILYSAFILLFSQSISAKFTVYMSYFTLTSLALLSVWMQLKYSSGLFAGILTLILFLRNRKYIFTLQTQQSNSTI